ncbi:putative pentatricopeptide repeat-containing protein At5g65820 [Salvia miltiorrhiza]|uniref:putative pentatricopeptide repeat-containing protein At5g65820 n=1 Tax=Salvia miltiorrhiza TaxID=226208 RepID=UPI0025AC7DB4|nr:putative pentatricopeptide repeat-containing protein At5g65820 [Salvia miltiorrhiza]
MQRVSSKKLCGLCLNLNIRLFIGKQNAIRKESSFHLEFHKSSNPLLFSTYSHLDSSKFPSKPNFTPESDNPISGDGNFRKLNEPKRGRGFIYLTSETEFSRESQIPDHDEFSADVEKVYRTLRKFHSRVPKLELALHESGVSVRSGLVERVLSRCGDAGNLGYRFFVWASKQPGYRHSYDAYKSMIKILSKMRQFGAVWALIEEMRKENPHLLSPEVFVVLMRRFASARMVKKAIEVLDEMPKYGCEPDEYVFGCLLDALCKNGSVKEAALLFEDMRIRFTPTIKHFTSLLYGWCKEGKLMEAKVVLVKMREAGFEPDIVVYNNLLNGYAVAGKMLDAFHLMQEMRRNGCDPNATSYTIMIQALCAREKTEEAVRVFIDMERHGCEADLVTYTTLISGFCKWGKLEKGYELLDSMVQKGYTPNSTTYLYFMLAHEKKEELEECLELMKEMRKIGVFPDLSIYNTAIRLSCKLGETEDSRRMMNELEEDGISPGVDTFIIMINGLIEQGCLVEACDYFSEMVGRGLLAAPQYGILKDLLNPLLRADKLQLAKDSWSCIIAKGCELNVNAWTIWIHALFSNGHVKDACSYCVDMMDAGLMPQPDTFAKLMKGLRKLYNRQIAAEITEKVRKMAAESQMTFKMYKRRGERDLKEKAKAKEDGRKRRARKRRWGTRSRKAGDL